MSKTKLRPEIKEAILNNQTLRLKLAYENTKTEATIRNWVNADDLMLTTAMNIDIICSELNVNYENIFALEL